MSERIRLPMQNPLDDEDPGIRERLAKLEAEGRAGPYGDSFELQQLLKAPRKNYGALAQGRAGQFESWSEDELYTLYADTWRPYFIGEDGEKSKNIDADVEQAFEKALPNSIVIDVGGGSGTMSKVLAEFSTGLYINVDLYPKGKRDQNPFDATRDIAEGSGRYEGKTRCMLVRADMLDFLSRLPDGSVNVTINGIDDNILHEDEAYAEALAEEIVRVLKPGGVVFGYGSVPLTIIEEWVEEKNPKAEGLSIQEDRSRKGVLIHKAL